MSADGMDSFLATQEYVTAPTLQDSRTAADATEPEDTDKTSTRASIEVSILEALDAVQLDVVELGLASANDLHYIERYVYGLANHANTVDTIHVKQGALSHRWWPYGSLFMATLALIAKKSDCAGFVWLALNWNTQSLNFYSKIGVKVLDGLLTTGFLGTALKDFAERRNSGVFLCLSDIVSSLPQSNSRTPVQCLAFMSLVYW